MCGISGIFAKHGSLHEALSLVGRMTAKLSHRGPDDIGLDNVNASPLTNLCVVFGHRRLSILDLSNAGHQPMCDQCTGNWLTYNGEIYNFRELRNELELRGHVFKSHSDTEVILKGYAEWGIGCWRRLRGIFAFGLWDAKYRELHLVRDHLGIKPLYFAHTEQGIVFASEVRAILASDCVPRRLSSEGLNSFLKYGSVQEPCTMVQGIESLPPGHYLTCTETGECTVRHYWSVSECVVRNWDKAPQAEDVRYYLEDSVRRQLIADVPAGVFLSGGVDSTVVAALASRAQPGAIRTFCIGVEQAEFDESAEAASTAKYLGCQHTTLVLEAQTVRKQLETALARYDQPSYDGINTYFISMLVRQAGMKVALSGLGGDELFVGYDGFSKARRMALIDEVSHGFPVSFRHALSAGLTSYSSPGDAIGGALNEVLDPELADSYFSSRTLFSRQQIAKMTLSQMSANWSAQAWVRREGQLAQAADDMQGIDRISFLELQTYMLSTLLRDSDQMSMAHGLELRVPLIDPLLLEHVLPVATRDKIAGRVGKQLLFKALGDLLPPEVVSRRKRGFTLPFREWMQRDLQQTVASRFMDIQPRGPWNQQIFRQIWTDFGRGRISWARVLSIFVLENWLQNNGVSL